MFNLGLLSLEFRGLAERLYWATCAQDPRPVPQARASARGARGPRDDPVATSTSATSRCSSRCRTAGRSTSCSRSCRSTGSTSGRRATRVLADITCDSDGKIDRFVQPARRPSARSSCTSCSAGEEYYLAAFLVGAYQETLGDLHNLFGDTHVVHIRLHDEGGWWIEEIVKGDTANKVLEYMEYDIDELYPRARARLRARGPRRPHDARREPGPEALLRGRAGRLRLPGAGGRLAAGCQALTTPRPRLGQRPCRGARARRRRPAPTGSRVESAAAGGRLARRRPARPRSTCRASYRRPQDQRLEAAASATVASCVLSPISAGRTR